MKYDGTDFFGFQFQKTGVPTIEGELRKALSRLSISHSKIAPAGRTDRGVHADEQVISLKLDKMIEPNIVMKAINSILPNAIKLTEVDYAPEDFHARYSSISRTYHYYFSLEEIPFFLQRNINRVMYKLNTSYMEEIRNIFLGTHNFKNFKSQGSVQFSDVKTISQFRYFEREFPTLCNDQESIIIKGIVIKANGFLYKMMRNIVGAIIEVLREKRTVKELKAMLHLTSVPFVIPTAPAKGLTLVEVEY